MVILKDFVKIIDQKSVIKIKLKNAELFEIQVCDMDLKKYPKLENQEIINLDFDYMPLQDDVYVERYIATLDYELKFGVENG
jgi:hypothetical protein